MVFNAIEEEEGLGQKNGFLFLIIIVLSVILALMNFSTIPFSGGDNFSYFLLSKALAQGKGYVELWKFGTPLHTQYPPMFPILLLPASLFDSYVGAKVIVFLCYILMLWFAWKFYRKIEDRETALLAFGILAFSPVVIEYSSLVLSEIPFTMFSIIALYLYSKKKYGQALLFATLTFLTRTIGVTLLMAMSWCYWRENK